MLISFMVALSYLVKIGGTRCPRSSLTNFGLPFARKDHDSGPATRGGGPGGGGGDF